MKSKASRLKTRRGTRIPLEPQLDHRLVDDSRKVADWLESMPRPWAVDIFCGAGGLSLGLADVGFSIIAAADSDKTALETHAHNIGGLTWCGDLQDPSAFIAQLDEWGIDQVDLVAGGPPCQPFSPAGASKIAHLVRSGARRPGDGRASLWRSFLSVIERLRPAAVLVENVPGFQKTQDGAALENLRLEFRDLGYTTEVETLESWRYGVPQHRTRLFVVGFQAKRGFEWPTPSGDKPTLRDAIGDLPVVGGGQRKEELPYEDPHPISDLARGLRRDLLDDERLIIRDHITRHVREDDAEIYRIMRPGQTYRDVPDELRRYRADIFKDKYNRLAWEELSRTITAHLSKDGYWYIHPSQDRTISIREAARIQTFPDSFRFAGYPTNRYRQIGNAVPPLLARAVGSSIRRWLNENQVRDSAGGDYSGQSIRSSLMEWHDINRRNYAWRQDDDPWNILLAELCLRRTRADQVAGVYESLKSVAGTPHDLLENFEDVEGVLWHLGLHWRAEAFSDMAEALIADHEGKVPSTYEDLIRLPGVGDYVASAVLCFGFGRHTALVDTNTTRIAGRLGGAGKQPKWKVRDSLYHFALPDGPDSKWNYALLDLGARVCKPNAPLCDTCPISGQCKMGRSIVVE